ncbi:MAG: hypothetical protein HN337_05405 [Deltaproteobacteria bacterium]|jgi:hypothetical protein|nr:hypothetical protein [Deltaproteobacteria bacterium]
MPHWNEMQVKAKELIEEGLKILKNGVSEAEVIAGKTADAAKLHMQAKKCRIEKYRALHELGDLIFEKYETQNKPQNIELTKHMRELLSQVDKLDDTVASVEKKLSKFTVATKKSAPKKKSATKKSKKD